MTKPSRKIAYVLGAGFSYGCNHEAPVGSTSHKIRMPLQFTLFEELCRFHHKKIKNLDQIAKSIRKYFSPSTYRATRGKGGSRHQDLFGLSVEEIVSLFDEIVSNKKKEYEETALAAEALQKLTVELISYLSTNGNPGQNKLLKKFATRLMQTDVVITFNWDTILDRALANQTKYKWHPSWGYGKTLRKNFSFSERNPPPIPKKYPRLLKLHGSINWVAYKTNSTTKCAITRGWKPGSRIENVVMMPPKMIKPEVWGRQETSNLSTVSVGNNEIPPNFYPDLWEEAEGHLAGCRRIVFIGYSFPPADFAVSNMLRRAISTMKVSTNSFPEIDIVDPNAADLAKRFEKSFKIKVPVENQYLSLQSYLSSERAK